MFAHDRLYERGPADCQSVVLSSPRRGYALRGEILRPGGDGFHHGVVVAMCRIVIRARLIFILVDPRVFRCLVGVGCDEVEVPLSMEAWREPSPNRQHPAPTGTT